MFPFRLSLVIQIIFAAWGQCVTPRSDVGRMLFVRTLRFTAKTRKQSQQHPWHRDCSLRIGKRLAAGLLGLESDWVLCRGCEGQR